MSRHSHSFGPQIDYVGLSDSTLEALKRDIDRGYLTFCRKHHLNPKAATWSAQRASFYIKHKPL